VWRCARKREVMFHFMVGRLAKGNKDKLVYSCTNVSLKCHTNPSLPTIILYSLSLSLSLSCSVFVPQHANDTVASPAKRQVDPSNVSPHPACAYYLCTRDVSRFFRIRVVKDPQDKLWSCRKQKKNHVVLLY
jgi:hypothetical protein